MDYIKLEDMTETDMIERLKSNRAGRKKGIEIKQKRKKVNETEDFLNNLPEEIRKVLMEKLMKKKKENEKFQNLILNIESNEEKENL